ncbi:MAG TPA: hypothetical protein ENK92_00970 [Bacteroidetes bacterium]|nr:hypothetical protein [Bacteroidota bacterium]
MSYIFEKENETLRTENETLRTENEALRTENETSTKYIEEIHSSVTWRIGSFLHKLKKRIG